MEKSHRVNIVKKSYRVRNESFYISLLQYDSLFLKHRMVPTTRTFIAAMLHKKLKQIFFNLVVMM